ncbi:hypothetical protein EIP91_006296 [Steccherinum ochraceum]|uniref:FAD-binding PCMH-type domain-containing protein n=1 Tax=Steccherinum ochraceum TaxID=92696 RepID=A0A4R0RLZ6_9APHY|nr:hypothetical protein EIP91_006296 [Steccherinum ochraceum]
MSTFESFSSQFKGDVVTPKDPTYQQALDRWAANTKRNAAIVAFVKDAEDVALAIKYARQAGLRIAIRGGGHSTSGSSSSDGGLVIDLSRYLKEVKVDPETKLIRVQGGAIWKTVDAEAIKHGLAAVGGLVNHTGVGGLSTGGGYGWLSGLHGLVIDNTVQLTVVTADGSILTANETENADLFWGVRGGGSNFGVVTEFVFKLHPQRPEIFAGPLVFTPDKVEKVAAFLDDWWPRAKPEEGIAAAIMLGPDGSPLLMTFIFYNGSQEDGRQAYKGLFDISPVMEQCGVLPYPSVNELPNPMSQWGRNYYFKGVLLSEKPSDDINPKNFDEVTKTLRSSPDHISAVEFEYLPKTKINSVPADSAPFRRDLQGNTLLVAQWQDDTPEKSRKAKEIVYALAKVLRTEGEGYGNYTSESDAAPTGGSVTTDRVKAMFREHYPRLQDIKKKYDPDMVFNQWYTIIPA